MGVSLSSPS
ncbi:hypothetical protein F383_05853 [Gossypium arboreum]|uniref:Uncharacterized protein n=1 Tax=Gossypium arboreum TaxID=29729 RepID=A0A0B0MEX0_GOSAR|nr:hypothetical protein F383_13610 [Gossypium arboreum]KHG26403.1 hypothetical protein F383_05853 [Gossypium arboreum]